MSQETCFHCGDPVLGDQYTVDDKKFCCNGCKSVFLLLSDSGLDNFYTYEKQAGSKPNKVDERKYDFLDVEEIQAKFIDFKDDKTIHTTLYLPKIHCSSCIYLLENLAQIHDGIQHCQSDFTKKEAQIVFDPNEIKFSELAVLLEKIGYPPNFEDRSKTKKKLNKQFLYKLGVSGFAFGSIMLWSFPEYLGIADTDEGIRTFTSWLSFFISLPVIAYAANEYYISAFKALRFKNINIDVPISIGIFALYFQSCYSIFFEGNPGYMDSFAGFVFFLLIGKWFQNRTYQSIAFERDQSAFFPVAVLRINDNQKEEIVAIEHIKKGDQIAMRNNEVVPCDAVLMEENTLVDYSFVTGESDPVTCKKGQMIYAGGRILGQSCVLSVIHENKRSRLSGLWEMHQPKKEQKSDLFSVIFLVAVLVVAMGTAISWFFIDASQIVQVTVAVLIVACPCALALSRPFTYGNTLRKLGRKGCYLKSIDVIENMHEITDIIFDKTGTLTSGSYGQVMYDGNPINEEDLSVLITMTHSSTHPMSQGIFKSLDSDNNKGCLLEKFEEIPGKGLRAVFKGKTYQLGTHKWLRISAAQEETASYFLKDDVLIGKFVFQSELRGGIQESLAELKKNYTVHVISGDSAKDQALITENLHPHFAAYHQTPEDKMTYIKKLQSEGKKVMMIGDGLNDVGALNCAEIGIAVAEDVSQFSPSADIILDAEKISNMPQFLSTTNWAQSVLKICFTFSILYNIIGLSFAVSGALSPLIAAVLMPLSSITIVGISTLVFLKK